MNQTPPSKRKLGRAEMKRRLIVVSLVASAMAVIDYVSYRWLIPWGDEMTSNHMMSLGYIVAFLVVFCNFVIFFAVVAYLLQKESYQSDEWQ